MSRPLRFCLATTFYPPASFGGDAIQVQRLAHALADRGHDVTVVHSREGYRALAGRTPAACEPHPGVRTVAVDAGTGALSPLATHVSGRPVLARRALQRALGGEFDILHFHNPSLLGGPAVLGMGSARMRLYTAHEQWLVCPTHVLWQHPGGVCETPHCVRCQLGHRRPPQLWRHGDLLRQSVARLDALIVPSRSSERLHTAFAEATRIERLGHFVPEPPDGAGETNHDRPYFLFAGRLETIKGADTLVAAFRRAPDHQLWIAGTGSLEGSLRRAAGDLPNVRFLGWRDAAGMDALYRGATAVIVPTVGHEAFGLVPIEAFARGTPAIVRRFGALAELAQTSGAALTYRSSDELDTALRRLAGEPGLRDELSEHGRAAYLEHWTEAAHVRRYFALIADLAGGKGEAELAAAAQDAAAAVVLDGEAQACLATA